MAVPEQEVVTHGAALRMPVEQVAGHVQSTLGQRQAAVIAGVSNPKAIGQWARGTCRPYPDAERRLREAYLSDHRAASAARERPHGSRVARGDEPGAWGAGRPRRR